MNKKRTICFLTRGGVNHDYGGLDRVTELLADFFEENGHKVFYLSQIKRPRTHPLRQYYLPNNVKLTSSENIKFYNQFINDKNIDVIINQEGNVNFILPLNDNNKSIVYITALHFNPNYISEFHFIDKFNKMKIPGWLKKFLLTVFKIPFVNNKAFSYLHRKLEMNYYINAQNSDKLVLLSEHFYKDMALLFKTKTLPKNLAAINNPIVTNKEPVHLSEKKKKLLFVGRLEAGGMKQVDKLLKKWKLIANKFPDWSLHLVGGGHDENMLKRMAENEKIPRVFFEGIQNPKPYYKEAAVFCFSSSSSEGWGMVLVEAQMYGCVPIAYDSYSSIKDIIKHNKNGVLIPAYDHKLYIKNLEKLMSDTNLRTTLGKNAMENVKRFDINVIGQQWLELIEEIYNLKNNNLK